MKYPYLRPKWWRLGERRPLYLSDGVILMTNKAFKGISNCPFQATNSAIKLIFTIQAIGPAVMALEINIKDFQIVNSCLNIYIGNNISKFVQYKEIKPLQI